MDMEATAVGFSVHTGWAAGVLREKGKILRCWTVALADEAHDARFVYHAASEAPATAERRISVAESIAEARAKAALKELPARTWVALPPAKRALPELTTILGSHPLLHAAEGELFRSAIARAAEALGLRITIVAKPIAPEVGKQPPPWGKDQKLAAALGWAALQ
jgi:hypothetical protein